MSYHTPRHQLPDHLMPDGERPLSHAQWRSLGLAEKKWVRIAEDAQDDAGNTEWRYIFRDPAVLQHLAEARVAGRVVTTQRRASRDKWPRFEMLAMLMPERGARK